MENICKNEFIPRTNACISQFFCRERQRKSYEKIFALFNNQLTTFHFAVAKSVNEANQAEENLRKEKSIANIETFVNKLKQKLS